MQNFISTFSPSKSFQFMNEQLCRERGSPRRHDCHGPPQLWQMGFREDVTRRRRLAAVARSDLWNNSRGGDYLLRDRRDEDGDPEEEFCALAALGIPKIELEAFAFTCGPEGYLAGHASWYAGLIESTAQSACFHEVLGHVEGLTNPPCQISTFTSGPGPGKGCAYAKD
jgi:hypothetical protein